MSLSVDITIVKNDFTLRASFISPSHGITAIYGPSGCGKTTLLRSIAGLEKAVVGSISMNGDHWLGGGATKPAHQRSIGYVFQDNYLFSHLNVRNNLLYGLKRTPKEKRRIEFSEAVTLVGVEKLIDKSVSDLSGGERQRVAIARALLSGPEILLMDEPMAALDYQSKSDILPYLEQLHETLSIPILYVSHATDEIARLADYIVLMDHGSTYKQGPLLETVSDIDSPLAEQANAFSILEGKVVENIVEAATENTTKNTTKNTRDHLLTTLDIDGKTFFIPATGLLPGIGVRIRIVAKDVSLCLDRPMRTSILNILETTIVDIRDNTSKGQCMVKLAVGNQYLLARISTYSRQHLALSVGDNVFAQIKAVAMVR